MRVLHLFSNFKWTGPAEPALSLCSQLCARGVDAAFACTPDSGPFLNRVVEATREHGLDPVLEFHLRKHRHPLRNFQDVRKLRRYLAENPVDIVHCHLDNDHEIAARALAGSAIPLVRSSYEGTGLTPSRRRRRMLARTTVLIEPSEIARDHDRAAYGLAPERAIVIPNAIDTARFDPARPLAGHAKPPIENGAPVSSKDTADRNVAQASSKDSSEKNVAQASSKDSSEKNVAQVGDAPWRASRLCSNDAERVVTDSPATTRARWGIPADAYVIGIVARMQPHRHFEDLFQAMRGVADVLPEARLVIVGRGTHQDTVAREPVRRLRLEEHVIFTGYIDGDDYVAALNALDTGVYLVPGSDGTCRAARELLAMGKPLVVADRGMLREIVDGGACGIVTDGTPGALRDALLTLDRDREHRTRLGEQAKAIATSRYALEVQAQQVHDVYERLLRRLGIPA